MKPAVSKPVSQSLADLIEDILPQTQCRKCGYLACRPYAEAIASGAADINQCSPGGADGVRRLAQLLGKPAIAINPVNGLERPRPVAVIDEALCIGCTLCIQACPVDAIVGAAKQMHTVLANQCTGCDLCVAPCPVDCITMVDVTGTHTGWNAWSQAQADTARRNYNARTDRLQRQKAESDVRLAAKADTKNAEAKLLLSEREMAEQARKKATIQAAIARAQKKKEEVAAAALAGIAPTTTP